MSNPDQLSDGVGQRMDAGDQDWLFLLPASQQAVHLILFFPAKRRRILTSAAPINDAIRPTTDTLEVRTSGQSPSENCARIKGLGFTTSKHIKMYREKFPLMPDPFVDGSYVSVHATRGIRLRYGHFGFQFQSLQACLTYSAAPGN